MAFRGRAMRRRTGSRTPGRGQNTYQDDVTSKVNQHRIRQAAYELVAFFDTFNVSPTHHKADIWASCEAQLYALWSDPLQPCAYDPDLGDGNEIWMGEQVYRATIEVSKGFQSKLVDMDHASNDAKRVHREE
eukprot:7931049-Pyramimonas_sp.AAC.1